MITGKIGGGKSLLALTKIIEQASKGGMTLSNFTFHEENFDKYLKRHFGRRLVEGMLQFHDFEEEPEFQKIVHFGVPELPVLVVCDETQLYFNQAESARLQARMMRLVSFLTQSRKCSVDVIFITQHDTTIWAQLRHQALFGYKCRDMRAVTLPFFGKLPMLGLTWVKYDIMSGEIMERGSTPLSKELFGLYDTRQMYDAQMRELQANAKIWQPVGKKAKGKFENETDSDNHRVRWWAKLFGMENRQLLQRAETGRLGGSEAGEVQAGE